LSATLDLAALPSLSLAARDSLPDDDGVYWVTVDGLGVVYVGQTNSVWFRWTYHEHRRRREALGDASISYLLEAGRAEHMALELSEIRRLRPMLNGSGNPDSPLRYPPGTWPIQCSLDAEVCEAVAAFRHQHRFRSLSRAARYLVISGLRDWLDRKRASGG
jgi:hypothetical protein